MSTDLNDPDIRAFFGDVASELPMGAPALPPGIGGRVRRRFLVNAALAGIGIALVAILGFAGLRALEEPAAVQPANSPTGATLPVASPSVPVPLEGAWTEIHPDYGTTVGMRAVAANDVVFVAVGDTSEGDGLAPVWSSSDGTTWTRAPLASAPDSNSLWDVKAAGPGFVAVGRNLRDDPAAWTSTDGQAW